MDTLRNIINGFKKNKNEKTLEHYKFIHNGKTGYGEAFDRNYWNRKDLVFELYNNYSKTDRPLLKWILKEELKGFEVDLPIYLLDIASFMLYKHMEINDVYNLYDAKFGAGSDHQAVIDIELIFGIEIEKTKEFLRTQPTNQIVNSEILSTIANYQNNPNAKFRTRNEYIIFYESIKLKNIQDDVTFFEKEVRI